MIIALGEAVGSNWLVAPSVGGERGRASHRPSHKPTWYGVALRRATRLRWTSRDSVATPSMVQPPARAMVQDEGHMPNLANF
jgi:hypothetical protein